MFKSTTDHHETDELLLMRVSSHQDTASSEHQPLGDTTRDALLEGVERFAEDHGLMQKLPLLQRGALLVQGEISLHDIPQITEKEIRALRYESERKWRQPKTLYFTILVCSIGAIVQGWAQTSANGANLFFPKAFGIGSDTQRDNLLVGLINSGPYLSVALFGAWTSGPINDMLGRRGAVFVGGVLCFVSTIGCSLSQNWPQLLAFRIVLGAGLGINASTVSVYAAECAPATIRGGLAVSWQMWTAFGVFLGFVANISVYNYGASAWRLQLASPFIPTIPLLILVYLCPESPAWYIKSGARYDLAFRSLCRLRNTELQAAKELYYTYSQERARNKSAQSKASFTGQIFQLFTIPRNRRATVASYVVMLSQQLCGINIISFYSSTIFLNAGFSTFNALLASCIFGFVNFVGAFPAVWTMDTLGRRSLLLLTLPPMAVTMLAAGLSFRIPTENPAHLGFLTFFIYLFCAEYSPGVGPVPSVYAAEVFPLSHREIGMGMAVATANCWAAVLSLTFPRILTAVGPQGAFGLYAGLNVVAFILVFLFLPETKQKTLEDLDHVFAIPTRTFIKYQTTEVLPWAFRRYLQGQKEAELRPLTLHGEYEELVPEEEDEDI